MAALLARVQEHIEQATPEEIVQTAVEAGIYTADGELTPFYRDDDTDTADGRLKQAMTVHLSDEAALEVEEQASYRGISVDEYLRMCVEEKLARDADSW